MKVSIITVAYNSAGTIGDTIRSVRNQSYDNIEHVIIDGASTDDTVPLIQREAPQAMFISEPDNGLYEAMNKGLNLATGDLIGILNSDDFYPESNIIESVVNAIKAKDTETLYGDLTYVDQFNTKKIVRKWVSGKFDRKQFKYGWMPPHPTFFVRKEVYKKYGTFHTELKSSADYELMLRLLYKHHVSTTYLPRCIVHMRAGGQSNVSLRNRILANREDRKAWHMNGLAVPFYTTLLKPMRKITQFVRV